LADAAKEQGKELADWRMVDVVDEKGELATNILVSRRSHEDKGYHVILLMNKDSHAKTFNLKISLPPDIWNVREELNLKSFGKLSSKTLRDDGVWLTLSGGYPAVLILSKE
jgi:hypothetical protein